jgi:P-type conjugative transfer protein TrbJ
MRLPLFPLVLAVLLGSAASLRAQALVFDAANFHENALIDAHAITQIGNQVRQLENEAQMLLRLEQNVRQLGVSIAPDLQRALSALEGRLANGGGMGLRRTGAEAAFAELFPQHASAARTGEAGLAMSARRAQEDYEGVKRSAVLQAEIADGVAGDRRLLADVMARSRGATGALAAAQAGNELAGLSVKEALVLEALLTAQSRSETVARARVLAGEEEARQRFKTFLGAATAYTGHR